MIHLPKPKSEDGRPYLAEDVFRLCVSRLRGTELKSKLLGVAAKVGRAAEVYDDAASRAILHKYPEGQLFPQISKRELVRVYELGMVPANKPARQVYDRILTAPRHMTCPLCGVGFVTTLDHHLPKSGYPVLSVTPNNLVPACTWCQKSKKESRPYTEEDQTLHPYFDDVGDERWLHAEVIQVVPAVFRFFAAPPDHWSKVLKQRLERHIEQFDLAKLYSVNAGRELAEIRDRLKSDRAAFGAAKVSDILLRDAKSIESVSLNSWKAAMYRAAAASFWFCDGGFLHT